MATGTIKVDVMTMGIPEVEALVEENKRLNSQIYNLQKIKARQHRTINYLHRELKRKKEHIERLELMV